MGEKDTRTQKRERERTRYAASTDAKIEEEECVTQREGKQKCIDRCLRRALYLPVIFGTTTDSPLYWCDTMRNGRMAVPQALDGNFCSSRQD